MRFLLLVCVAVVAITSTANSVSGQVREKAPDFVLADMDGRRVDMAAHRGKVAVLNLWFINCPNCVAEIKMLNQLVDQYGDRKDIVFLGLAASTRSDLQKFLIKNPFKYTVVPDATSIIIGQFGSPDRTGNLSLPFPMHYVVDRDGFIVTKAQGIKGIDAVKAELQRQFTK